MPNLIGTAANQVPVNGMLGTAAFVDVDQLAVTTLTYANRANLRNQDGSDGMQAIVATLGLFVWKSASTEPDDDKTCFATASGCWLMQAAHWDVVDEYVIPEIAAAIAAKTLTGSATCAITSVASLSSTSFTGTVTGAAVGDRVVATPPATLSVDPYYSSSFSYHAWVSAPNTVTVMLCNSYNSPQTTNPAIRTAWPISVIKS